ncbi:MAG TPA: trypsin-like peptidase domain-containing protein, partial [Bryobacteraceae bacterium]|nr:trypsin-like peptidase domain-containing protein [Bryobacteraceae bacterium]
MRPTWCLTLVLLVCRPLTAQSGPGSLPALSRMFQELVDRVDPAVVQILTRRLDSGDDRQLVRTSRGTGSGVMVDPEGYIVTNAHVVGGAEDVQVLVHEPADKNEPAHSILKRAGRLVTAKVIGQDRETDLAVVKIDGKNFPHLPFGDSESLRQGQLVFAIGSPFGLENSVTMGVVSSVARQVRPDDPMIYIQTDAAINPGNSGGPLVNAEGRLMGINSSILSSSGSNAGVGFAAPSNIVKSVYAQIRQQGFVRRGQIGLVTQTISYGLAQALGLNRTWGVLVSDVRPGGAAEAAGIEEKDVILTLNGKPMENSRQFGVNIYANA